MALTEIDSDSGQGLRVRTSPVVSRRRLSILGWIGVAAFVGLFPLAFIHYDIYVDEAWIGQQTYSLLHQGAVYTDLFRDSPPLDGRIVVYHTLLVWAGTAASFLLGWGLHTLRAVSLVAGLVLLGLILVRRPNGPPRNVAIAAVPVLMFTPLFCEQMIIFRPEMLLTTLGFAGYLLLERGIYTKRAAWIALSGLLAGLSGSVHAIGLAFVVAGFVPLLIVKQFRALFLYIIGALVGFFPYMSGYFIDRDLFFSQVFHNRLLTPDPSATWWQFLLNALNEHQRWFRKPDVIGISVLFILALICVKRTYWKEHSIFWSYLVALAVALALAPLPKLTRYMLPLTPFMALVIAETISRLRSGLEQGRPVLRKIFVGWAALFFAFGTISLVTEAFARNDRIEVNRQLASWMSPGALVMTPFPYDFVFNEQPNFRIQGFAAIERNTIEGDRSVSDLEKFADSLGVNYIILTPRAIENWGLDRNTPYQKFTQYSLMAAYPQYERWLLKNRR